MAGRSIGENRTIALDFDGCQRCMPRHRATALVHIGQRRRNAAAERVAVFCRCWRCCKISAVDYRLLFACHSKTSGLRRTVETWSLRLPRCSASWLLPWECHAAGGLRVCRRMNVLRRWWRWQGHTIPLRVPKQVKSVFDRGIVRVQVLCTSVRIDRVVDLVITGLVQTAEVVPNLADVRVESDCSRVRVQGVTILVDLVVEHPDGAPEGRITAVSVDGLLVRLVRLVVLLATHKCSTEEIPTLGVGSVCG